MIRELKQAMLFLEDPRAIPALIKWSTFSFTSFRMVRVLERKGLRPRTVLDVGANVGQFTVAVAGIFSDVTVHAFEPLPSAVARLRHHTAGLPLVTVYDVALGDSETVATLRVSANSVSSSLLPMGSTHDEAFPEAAVVESIEVAVTTLDRALGETALTGPVLLKIDAQGYEAHVLRGASATLARADYVLVETSLVPLYEGEPTLTELAARLAEQGFRFDAAVGSLESPKTGEILQLDALFCRA